MMCSCSDSMKFSGSSGRSCHAGCANGLVFSVGDSSLSPVSSRASIPAARSGTSGRRTSARTAGSAKIRLPAIHRDRSARVPERPRHPRLPRPMRRARASLAASRILVRRRPYLRPTRRSHRCRTAGASAAGNAGRSRRRGPGARVTAAGDHGRRAPPVTCHIDSRPTDRPPTRPRAATPTSIVGARQFAAIRRYAARIDPVHGLRQRKHGIIAFSPSAVKIPRALEASAAPWKSSPWTALWTESLRSFSPRLPATGGVCSSACACASPSPAPDADETPNPGESCAATGAAAGRGEGAIASPPLSRRADHRLRPGRRPRRQAARQAGTILGSPPAAAGDARTHRDLPHRRCTVRRPRRQAPTGQCSRRPSRSAP